MGDGKPEYQRFIKPALDMLSKADRVFYFDEICETLSEMLDIPIEQLEQRLPSGRQTLFENQLQWALSYLEQDGLIASDGANAFKATGTGRRTKQANQTAPDMFFQVPRHQDTSGQPGFHEEESANDSDPEQVIDAQFAILHERVSKELIERIHSFPPEFFENLIIDLLLAMKYGNRKRDLQQHLGRSGDGGVDGAIRQDQLGLDTIYIQAKRYRPGLAVPVSSVRDFAGALQAHKATKGVFVSTSHFTKAAHEFVNALPGKIALINGQKLASLLVRHNIGVRTRKTWEIKHIDEEYFSKNLPK